MLRAAIGLTSMLLLTACAGSAPQVDARDAGFTNAKIQSASYTSDALPTPKFKPVWLALTEMDSAPQSTKKSEEKNLTLASSKVSDHELDKNRGTFVPEVLNSTVLEATATQNVAVNSVTGDNIVNSSAFSNAQGLVNLIQNSGNNVVIQSSTVVNLTFQ